MTDPLRITAEMLEARGASCDNLTTFRRQWPNGIVPTARTVPVIVRLDLDVEWAADVLLRGEYQRACGEAIATAWKAYDEAIDTGQKAYDEAIATAFIRAWRAQGGDRE